MCVMHPDGPDALPSTYATLARRRGYIKAMQQLARSRSQNGPARVYVSVAPRITERPSWPKRLEDIRAELPENIELVTYHDAFDDHSAYTEGWPDLAASLDGLIVVAVRKNHGSRVCRRTCCPQRVADDGWSSQAGPAARDRPRTGPSGGPRTPTYRFGRPTATEVGGATTLESLRAHTAGGAWRAGSRACCLASRARRVTKDGFCARCSCRWAWRTPPHICVA